MPRLRDVNESMIAEAASRLMRGGVVPTATLVKRETGGSFAVVKELMDAWEHTQPAKVELERIAPRVLGALVGEIYRISAECEQRHAQQLSISKENYAALFQEHKDSLADHMAAEEGHARMTSERDGALALAAERALENTRLRAELELERAAKSALDVAYAKVLERGLANEEEIRSLKKALQQETVEHFQTRTKLKQEEVTNSGLLGSQTELEQQTDDLQRDKEGLTREREKAIQEVMAGQVQVAQLSKELVVTTKMLDSFGKALVGGKRGLRGAKAKVVQGDVPRKVRPKRLTLKLRRRSITLPQRTNPSF